LPDQTEKLVPHRLDAVAFGLTAGECRADRGAFSQTRIFRARRSSDIRRSEQRQNLAIPNYDRNRLLFLYRQQAQ
jgi:hypothetical protein